MNTSTIIMIIAIIAFVVIPTFKARVIPVKKLIIMPALFIYLCYQTISDNFNVTLISYCVIALGFLIGFITGVLVRKNTPMKSDKKQQLIWLPGTYFSLIMFILIFSIHFLIGYLQAVSPAYLTQFSYGELALLFLLSGVSSITIGASSILYFKYLKSESIDLKAIPINDT